MYHLLLKLLSLQRTGLPAFTSSYLRSQVFPHLATPQRAQLEGSQLSPPWEHPPSLDIPLPSDQETDLIPQSPSNEDLDDANETWKSQIGRKLHKVLTDLTNLEDFIDQKTDKNDNFFDFPPNFPSKIPKISPKTENFRSIFCISSLHCLPYLLIFPLFLLFSLFFLIYIEWTWHKQEQALTTTLLAVGGMGVGMSIAGFVWKTEYLGVVCLGIVGMILGYAGFYAFLWGKEVWKAVWTSKRPTTPLSPSSDSQSDQP